MAFCEDCGLPIAAGQRTCPGCEALHLAHNRVQQRAWSSATWRACGQALQAVVHMAEVAAAAEAAGPAAPLPAGHDARAERSRSRSRSLDSYSPDPRRESPGRERAVRPPAAPRPDHRRNAPQPPRRRGSRGGGGRRGLGDAGGKGHGHAGGKGKGAGKGNGKGNGKAEQLARAILGLGRECR